MDFTYKLIRSKGRRTMVIQATPQGFVVKAPMRTTQKQIDDFLETSRDWIEKQIVKMDMNRLAAEALPVLTREELRELAARAAQYIPERVKYYAPLVGVTYGRITIRNQRTRWGSCSAQGNLNFNCLLMLAPEEVIDSVVVHELCHRKEMNHSRNFYAEVLRVFPDYYKHNKWLKDNGQSLMSRLE